MYDAESAADTLHFLEEVFKAKSIDTLKVVARQFPEQFDAVIF